MHDGKWLVDDAPVQRKDADGGISDYMAELLTELF